MREVDWDVVPETGKLPLCTVRDLQARATIYLADFRDIEVLIWKPTGSFIGLSRSRGMRFCSGPIEMMDGVWFGQENLRLQKHQRDVHVQVEFLEFQPFR